ncbi:hypothetical protein FHR70_000653 [Microvirga lupini]|uniref:Uncharacterized protein n=1 Tax=Microvirga lupini TaxID=420324 RepID=A0A7W4VI22_9HYPH|nr:hypothetical protein [Microvirga lupini]MBB3017613.1 hypothetical protein [Microvirga lupini]
MREQEGVVVLGFGPQPIDFISKAAKLCGKTAVMCPDTARMAGANLAAGTPAELAKLRERLEAGAVLEAKVAQADSGLSQNAIMWLATGERGTSSETLFTLTTGHDCTGDWGYSHPHDPDDLSRCRKLLDQCPELVSCLPRVAAAGPEWAALVPRWDELCALMDEESPDWREGRGSAPKTYALMKSIFASAQQ